MTEVAAALIWQEGKFLICQRPKHKTRALEWEFVGGKQEQGETLQETLIRECREELGITVSVGPVFLRLIHEYTDITIRLSLFYASIAEGSPQLLEHNALAWITPEEIPNYNFCPADKEILAKIAALPQGAGELRSRLISLRDEAYRLFHAKLMPTVDTDTLLGVRMPKLRSLAKEFAESEEKREFLSVLPHDYYEENNLHALLLMQEKDFGRAVEQVEKFLPYVNNWATCDLLKPAVFGANKEKLLPHIQAWLKSKHAYTVRFGMKMLLDFYLDGAFCEEHLALVASVESEEYYVNMMQAWYFATALAKQYDAAVPYLQEGTLSRWVHNKTIQKAVESYRISEEQKVYLKTLRRK